MSRKKKRRAGHYVPKSGRWIRGPADEEAALCRKMKRRESRSRRIDQENAVLTCLMNVAHQGSLMAQSAMMHLTSMNTQLLRELMEIRKPEIAVQGKDGVRPATLKDLFDGPPAEPGIESEDCVFVCADEVKARVFGDELCFQFSWGGKPLGRFKCSAIEDSVNLREIGEYFDRRSKDEDGCKAADELGCHRQDTKESGVSRAADRVEICFVGKDSIRFEFFCGGKAVGSFVTLRWIALSLFKELVELDSSAKNRVYDNQSNG